jgi:hypothetical protein
VTFANRFAAATTVNGFIAGTHILARHAFDGGHHVWNTVIVSLE